MATTDEIRADVDAIRSLLDDAFDGDFSEEDWSHCVGGRHVVVTESDAVVAHASLVGRGLRIGTELVRVGYVEAVATASNRQQQGLGSIAMAAISGLLRTDAIPGFLSTGEWHFYERLGWERWRGPSSVISDDGRQVRTPEEDGGIMVYDPSRRLDRSAAIACFERPGDDW